MTSVSPSLEKLRKKLEKDPNSLIFTQVAEEYRKEGLLNEALTVCLEGLRRHPNYWSARVVLGRIRLEMGSRQEALEELEKAIKAVPDNLIANRLLGDIYFQENRLQEALKRYKIAQMLVPGDREIVSHIQDIERRLSVAPEEKPVSVTPPPLSVQAEEREEIAPPTLKIPAFQEPVISPPLSNQWPPQEEQLPSGSEPTLLLNKPFGEDELFPALEEQGFDANITPPLENPLPQKPSEDAGPALAEIAAILLDDQKTEEPASTNELRVDQEFTLPPAAFPDGMELQPVLEEEKVIPEVQDRTQPMAEKEEIPDEDADELTTQTLAELYESQGLLEKAIRVYQKLLLNDPTNMEIVEKLKRLNPMDTVFASPTGEEKQEEKAHAAPFTGAGNWEGTASEFKSRTLTQLADERRRKITTLENWLASIRRERS
jgi:tetratricopeptide (TPR) repeat protein